MPDVEKLLKSFKNLFDKKAGLDQNFSFNQMAIEIRELREGKGIAANPRKRTLEAIEGRMDKNEEIDDSDNFINNSNGKNV